MRCPECASFCAKTIDDDWYCPVCKVELPRETERMTMDEFLGRLPRLCAHQANLADALDLLFGRAAPPGAPPPIRHFVYVIMHHPIVEDEVVYSHELCVN